jgi:uncharacterized protein (TIGR00299 family) protein
MSADLQGQHLHFDCVSGIAGDMTLGALIDLGVPADLIREAIKAVGLGDDRMRVESVVKSGIASTNVSVRCDDEEGGASEGHDHHHYAEIRQRIEQSSLSKGVIALSLKIFDRVAEAEAKLHGTTVEAVAFHEVGAVDSIVDIVGAAAALHWLAPASVSASPVAMGRGTIRCAHGILPVPSPAAVEILRVAEAPVSDGGIDKELCTPTGAAILAAVVKQWGSMPVMTPVCIGYGAGDIELPDRPNVLRVMLGRTHTAPQETSGDTVTELEANIDDMSSELCEHVTEELFSAGALDVWWTPITMKKGRPALALRVMCGNASAEAVMSVIFCETSSIGVRTKETVRRVLQREIVQVETEYGPIPVKVARYLGKVVNAAPEFEACRRQAKVHDVPLKQVFAAASSAYLQSS